VNAFIQQCRREWRRLGVRSAVADEMAATRDRLKQLLAEYKKTRKAVSEGSALPSRILVNTN